MRSKILTPFLLILGLLTSISVSAQLPYTFDAGLYGCPNGANNYVASSSKSIAGTDYDSLYQSFCTSSGNFTYTLTNSAFVAGNSYDIILHFSEIFYGLDNPDPSGGVGSRIFSVELEGIRILDSLDIYAAVGPNNALVYRKMVQLDSDADLDITFISHEGEPILNAIEVLPIGDPINFPPYVNLFDAPGFSLPVVWGAFEAKTTASNKVDLFWTTPEISASKFFEVEMDFGQGYFTTSGTVEASDSQTEYAFQTRVLPVGSYQFRLRFVGIDGHEQVSEVRQVEIRQDLQTQFTLFPNPANQQSQLTIRSSQTGSMQVRVLDLRGVEMSGFQTIGSNQEAEASIQLENMIPGVYLVQIIQNGHQQYQKISIR